MPKQSDILNTPIDLGQPESQSEEDLVQWGKQANELFDSALNEKYQLAFSEYSIDSQDHNRWKWLAQKLLHEKYAGFSEQKPESKKGRPILWNDYALALLWFDIQETLKHKKASTPYEACAVVSAQEPWQTIMTQAAKIKKVKEKEDLHKNRQGSLYTQYKNARKLSIVETCAEKLENVEPDEAIKAFYDETYVLLAKLFNKSSATPHPKGLE